MKILKESIRMIQKSFITLSLVCFIGLAGCGDEGNGGFQNYSLIGTKWKCVGFVPISNPDVVRYADTTKIIEFLEDGTFSGIEGLGSYRIDIDSMSVYIYYNEDETLTVYKYTFYKENKNTMLRLDFISGRLDYSMNAPIAWICKLIGE